jgi:hypothetical protein
VYVGLILRLSVRLVTLLREINESIHDDGSLLGT